MTLRRTRGFTLVEVMVALAVVAIALPAVVMSLSRQMDDTGYLRDKSIAHMVAANKLAEMRLVIAAARSLSAGKDGGVAEMAQRDWYWSVETKATEADQFYRVEIRVAAEEDQAQQPLYTLVAFMSSDLEVDLEGIEGAGEGTNSDADTDAGTGTGTGLLPGAQSGAGLPADLPPGTNTDG